MILGRYKRRRLDYTTRKEVARALILERIVYFQARYAAIDPKYIAGMKFNRLSVRMTRSRWGSCSSKRNLNFNYRILDLSPEMRDYVIVHELCHLVEFNHKPAFWNLVSLVIPGAREIHAHARKIRLS